MSKDWAYVRDWLLERIDSGEFAVGDALPSEQELQLACGVGRHSLRRAIAELAAEGRVTVEQGRGSFVSRSPQVIYRIGRTVRWRESLLAQGLTPKSEPMKSEIVPAPPAVATALGLKVGAPVVNHLRRDFADDVPISLDSSWHCANRFSDIGERRMRGESVTEIYRSYGLGDYRRRQTILLARNPFKWEARILQQPIDRPVVEQEKIDVTSDGIPIGYSEAIWSAGRIRFLIDTDEDPD